MKKAFGMLLLGLIALALAVWVAPMSGNAQIVKKKKKTGGGSQASELKPYPPCNGPKKRIAIYRFKDGVNNATSAAIRGSLLEALQHELQQTGCFIILVTNEDLGDSAAEIGHGQSGMGVEARSPQAGKQLGAQAIFQGTLVEVAFTQGEGGQIGLPSRLTGGVAANVGLTQTHVKVVILVKMFDPETRILEFSERAEGEIRKRSVKLKTEYEGVVVGGQLNKETPLGDATLRAIHDAVYIIVTKMNSIPWQATILKVSGNTVIIRGGKDSGIQVGQMLNTYKPGETLEDPDTGEMLRLPPDRVGQVRVTRIVDKFIYAEIVSGPAVSGMWVRLE